MKQSQNNIIETFNQLQEDIQYYVNNERLYDSEDVLNKDHVKRLLLERYLFYYTLSQLKEQGFNEDFIQSNFEPHYVYEEIKKENETNIDYVVKTFDPIQEEIKMKSKEYYFEKFDLLQRRVQKRIQTGILGFFDEKNSQYIDKNQPLYKEFLENKNKRYELVKQIQKQIEVSIKTLMFLPSSPFMFNQFRKVLDNMEIMKIQYKPIDETTEEEWNKIYEIQDPQYGSCYQMGSIEDNIKQIYEMLYKQQEVFRHQGGFGVNFSKLRSKWQQVSTIKGKSSGQVSFMKPFNETTELIQLHQSTKRGQNMFLLNIDHPEIYDFVNQKIDFEKNYKNLKYQNLSVGLFNNYIDKVLNNEKWVTVDPHDKSIQFEQDQRKIWQNIIYNQTLHQEPGIINWDHINKDNHLKQIKDEYVITSTNPCVVGNTKVLTDEGLIDQKDLKEGMKVFSPISNQFFEIKKVYNNGIKKVYRLELKTGDYIIQTQEHKVYTKNVKTKKEEWKMIKDLDINEDLIMLNSEDVSDFIQRNYEQKYNMTLEDVLNQEIEITDDYKNIYKMKKIDWYWLLGYVTGNGTIYIETQPYQDYKTPDISVGIPVSKNDSETMFYIIKILQEQKVPFQILPDKPYNTEHIQVFIKDLAIPIQEQFEIEIPKTDETLIKDFRKYPKELYNEHPEYIKQYLSGLFQQSGIIEIQNNSKQQFGLQIIHEDIIKFVRDLLSIFGIITDFKQEKRKDKYYPLKDTIYKLLIKVFQREKIKNVFKFLKGYKKDELEQFLNVKKREGFISKYKWNKIKNIKFIGEEEVFDIQQPDDYVWVTNNIVSYDCSEFISQDSTVCNLGSINLFQMIDKNETFRFDMLEKQTLILHTLLNISNFQNDFPLPELTHNTRRFRNTGIGYMGLSSVLLYQGLKYGSQEQYEYFKEIMYHMVQIVLENSKLWGNVIGQYESYDKLLEIFKNLYNEQDNKNQVYKKEFIESEFDKYGIYTGQQLLFKFYNRLNEKDLIYLFGSEIINKINNNYNKDVEKYLKETKLETIESKDSVIKLNEIYYLLNIDNPFTQTKIGQIDNNEIIFFENIQNERMIQIQPTGSISYITQVSSGVEPIFFLQYSRRINPDMPSEYTVTVYDIGFYYWLKNKVFNNDQSKVNEIINKVVNGEIPEKIKEYKHVVTTSDLDFIDRLQMLYISNQFIDMNTSITFNIQRDTKINNIDWNKFKQYNNPEFDQIIEKYKKYRFDIKPYIENEILQDKNYKLTHLKQLINFIKNGLWNNPDRQQFFESLYDQLEENIDDKDKRIFDKILKTLKEQPEYENMINLFQFVSDFYIIQQLFKIKGSTTYIEGSRTPVLTRVKKKVKQVSQKDVKQSDTSKLVFNIGGIEVDISKKTGKIIPKERPIIMEVLKKTVKFKINGDVDYKVQHIEVGFQEDKEPFEVFIRQTNSTQQYTELFNQIGRLISLQVRSGIDINEQLKQLRKTKNWRNEYSPITQIIQDTVEELIDIYKKGDKKKKEQIQNINELKKNWILTPKGYYIDEKGKHRCPVCGSEIVDSGGCMKCIQCNWEQCMDT